MGNKLEKYYRNIPKVFKPETNTIWNALLQGFAQEDEQIATQLANTKAQLFIKTASGVYLDRLASALNVEVPSALGLTEEKYRELIPNLSLKYKQIRKTFYDTMDIFWGPTYAKANTTSSTFAPFNVVVGDVFKVKLDGKAQSEIVVKAEDIVTAGAMTLTEALAFFNKISGLTASDSYDITTGHHFVNLRTNTPGLKGSIEIVNSTIIAGGKITFAIANNEIWQQDQRTVIYEINPKEIIIEIPATVPMLRDTLKGSHHMHLDATLAGPVAPDNGIWQGSFLMDAQGSYNPFTISGKRCQLQTAVLRNEVLVSIDVDDTSDFTSSTGTLIFDFGNGNQEYPVTYRGVPNSHTLLIDPSYKFLHTHAINSYVNALVSTNPITPRVTGEDLAIYLNSPSNARAIVQTILESLAAAGVTVTFVILLPDYKYLITNPYL